MDKAIVILLIILLIVFGIAIITIRGGDSGSNSGSTGYNSYPVSSGGGCGR